MELAGRGKRGRCQRRLMNIIKKKMLRDGVI